MVPRVVIPSTLRPQMLKLLHEGHFGIQRMKQLARTAVYWPNIDNDIVDAGPAHLALTIRNSSVDGTRKAMELFTFGPYC